MFHLSAIQFTYFSFSLRKYLRKFHFSSWPFLLWANKLSSLFFLPGATVHCFISSNNLPSWQVFCLLQSLTLCDTSYYCINLSKWVLLTPNVLYPLCALWTILCVSTWAQLTSHFIFLQVEQFQTTTQFLDIVSHLHLNYVHKNQLVLKSRTLSEQGI